MEQNAGPGPTPIAIRLDSTEFSCVTGAVPSCFLTHEGEHVKHVSRDTYELRLTNATATSQKNFNVLAHNEIRKATRIGPNPTGS